LTSVVADEFLGDMQHLDHIQLCTFYYVFYLSNLLLLISALWTRFVHYCSKNGSI